MSGGMSAQPATSSPQARLPLAGLLKGYTMAELGFDPMVVPGWITTILPSQSVRELASMPAPLCELGLLIDGITDVGFRNVLNTAKRDFQLRLRPDELQAALAGGAPPTLPNLSSLSSPSAPLTGQSPFGAQGGVMHVAAQPPSASPFATSSSPFTTPEPGAAAGQNSPFLAPASPFQTSAPPAAPSSPFGAPGADTSGQPAPAFTSAFGMPAVPAPAQPSPQASLFQAAAPTSPFGKPAFQSPAPKPQDPFAAPIPQQPAPSQPLAFTAAPSAVPPAFSSPQYTQAEPAPVSYAQPEPPSFRSQPSPMAETTVLPPERPQEPAAGFAFTPPAAPNEGFSSDQLFGRQPTSAETWNQAAASAATAPLQQDYTAERARPAPAYDMPATPSSFIESREEFSAEPPPPPRPAFVPPRVEEPAQAFREPRPTPPRSTAPTSNLGIQPHDTDPDQILLRALLNTDSDLTPQRVVEMTCALPGIAACVCIQGNQAISHIGAHKPQAREFQRQATELAQHLRTLAPLIGIEGAETFTMNSGDRLMTFCFPERAILGVLHDAEPTLGLRDKITLIARELSRMIS